jgi:hypothetical protein
MLEAQVAAIGKSGNHRVYYCWNCDHGPTTGAGLKAHLRTCLKRPEREDLVRACDEGLSSDEIGVLFDVSASTVCKWLHEEGLESGRPHAPRSGKEIRVYPGYAAKYGHRGGCDNCNALPVCELLQGVWVLCEALDQEQKEAMEREGFDWLRFTTELWLEYPKLYTTP